MKIRRHTSGFFSNCVKLIENSQVLLALACSYVRTPSRGSYGLLWCSFVHHYTALHSWVKWQKPAKNLIEKSAKLTHHTCACSSLTNFEYEEYAITGNGRCIRKICLEKFVKSHSEFIFGGFLVIQNHNTLLCYSHPRAAISLAADRIRAELGMLMYCQTIK